MEFGPLARHGRTSLVTGGAVMPACVLDDGPGHPHSHAHVRRGGSESHRSSGAVRLPPGLRRRAAIEPPRTPSPQQFVCHRRTVQHRHGRAMGAGHLDDEGALDLHHLAFRAHTTPWGTRRCSVVIHNRNAALRRGPDSLSETAGPRPNTGAPRRSRNGNSGAGIEQSADGCDRLSRFANGGAAGEHEIEC